MKIIAMEVGYIATNCYIVINEETHQAVVIDPGGRIRQSLSTRAETLTALWRRWKRKMPKLTLSF